MANRRGDAFRRGLSPIPRDEGGGFSPFVRLAAIVALAAALLSATGGAWAGPARLTLTGAVSFPDADPDAVPLIASPVVTLGVEVLGILGTPWSLTVIANSDLQSGNNVIPISNVSWTVTPNPPLRDGRLSTIAPFAIATGVTGHSRLLATFNFFMANSWNYVPGNYAATATFTLAAP